MRAHNPNRSGPRILSLGLPVRCCQGNPFSEHESVVKLAQDVLQVLESSHSRSAGPEQGAIQLGGVAEPATAPPNRMQGHRGEVLPQRAQLFECHTSMLPAHGSQPQGRLTRIRTAACHQDVQVFPQSGRIEICERFGELPVGTGSRGGKPVVQKSHDGRRNLGAGRFPIEKCGSDIEIASLARQTGQLTQALA